MRYNVGRLWSPHPHPAQRADVSRALGRFILGTEGIRSPAATAGASRPITGQSASRARSLAPVRVASAARPQIPPRRVHRHTRTVQNRSPRTASRPTTVRAGRSRGAEPGRGVSQLLRAATPLSLSGQRREVFAQIDSAPIRLRRAIVTARPIARSRTVDNSGNSRNGLQYDSMKKKIHTYK